MGDARLSGCRYRAGRSGTSRPGGRAWIETVSGTTPIRWAEHQGDPRRVDELMRLVEDRDETLLVQVSVYDGSKPLETTSPMHIDYGGPLELPDRIIDIVPAIRS